MADNRYYNWDETLSYDARIYMIVGAKGIGKTYGLRKKMLAWNDRRGDRFLEVYRTLNEKQQGRDDWAAKLLSGGDTPRGWAYQTKGRRLVRYEPDADGNRPKGAQDETVGYFASLSELQSVKRSTFDANTNNVVFDEAIIDRRLDRHHRYMPYEWETLSRVIDSVLREQQGDKRRTRLFLLANAVDLVNPYFRAAGITSVPKQGYSWYLNKNMLLHYVPNSSDYASAKDDSLSAIMMAAEGGHQFGMDSEFIDGKNKFVINKKPRCVRYLFGMRFEGMGYGVWETYDGNAYVDTRCLDGVRCYALTAEDGSPNLLQARRSTPQLRMMGELYYAGQIRYSDEATRRGFLRAMTLFGVK